MKITDTYKALKKKHSHFFNEYNADDRIKHKKEIISLKKFIGLIMLLEGCLRFS